MARTTRVVLLAGGYGGARMAHGFALLGESVELDIVGNTADDLELHGLHVSPDLDTVMYTLAGLANTQTGWGVSGETWSAAEMLERYGQPTWFALGDRDLATHITRTALLRSGSSLTDVTAHLTRALGVASNLLPMTDDPVRTKLLSAEGWLEFQDYFVRRRHALEVTDVRFDGIEAARPTAAVREAIDSAQLIVIAPSNPFVSVGPILAVPGLGDRLLASRAPVVAISPIVGGAALRGPAAALMRSLADLAPTSAGVAAHYARAHPGLLDFLVIDRSDAAETTAIAATGIRPVTATTVIASAEDRRRLAAKILSFTGQTGELP